MRDDLFGQEDEKLDPGNLRIEYVYESWGPHLDGSSYYRDAPDGGYQYEDQLQSFRDNVNEFLEEHEVYDITIEKSADKHGQVRHEAWIVYEDGE